MQLPLVFTERGRSLINFSSGAWETETSLSHPSRDPVPPRFMRLLNPETSASAQAFSGSAGMK